MTPAALEKEFRKSAKKANAKYAGQTLELTGKVLRVTRHFGGTLLGAGGLVRAYSGAVAAALEDARTIRRLLREVFGVTVEAGQAGQLEAAVRNRGIAVRGVEYGATEVVLTVAVAPGDVGSLRSLVASITAGSASLQPAGQDWVDEPL